MEQEHPLTPQFGLVTFATRGMLLTTQAMAIIVAAVRYAFDLLPQGNTVHTMEPNQVGLNVIAALLFFVDIALLIFTRYLVQHKRV